MAHRQILYARLVLQYNVYQCNVYLTLLRKGSTRKSTTLSECEQNTKKKECFMTRLKRSPFNNFKLLRGGFFYPPRGMEPDRLDWKHFSMGNKPREEVLASQFIYHPDRMLNVKRKTAKMQGEGSELHFSSGPALIRSPVSQSIAVPFISSLKLQRAKPGAGWLYLDRISSTVSCHFFDWIFRWQTSFRWRLVKLICYAGN